MIKALPSSLRSFIEPIRATVENWPTSISVDHAIRWVLQFDADDYPLAVRILENLDVLGHNDVRAALEVAHAKLLRKMADKGTPMKGNNTIYAGVGNSAKSGALIAYHYRIAADLPESDFLSGEEEQQLDLTHIENIVLVDDVIGTGHTVAKEVSKIAEEIYTLSRTRNIFVLTVAGYEDGIQHVLEETGASVVCALEYTNRDTVSLLDATFFDGLPVSERNSALERIKRYCRAISKSDLGYGGVGGLLVFDHNTPNTTLPIVWHNGNGWLPLFQRARKIPGAAKVLKSAQEERSQQEIKQNTILQNPPREEAELTLFVEGKLDELFVDCLRQCRELAERVGVGEITAIALGGLYQSERLLELLRSAKKYAVFVLDDDEPARRASTRARTLANVPVLLLKPSFVAMLDMDKIHAHRDRFPELPEQTGAPYDSKWLHEFELAVLKRGPLRANSERILQIVNEYLDERKYEEFVSDLRAKTDEAFARAVYELANLEAPTPEDLAPISSAGGTLESGSKT